MAKSTSEHARPHRENVRGAATRARLLDAALSSFSARGFHGTSTRDIADAAGMSPAAVYTHYPTKEQLLFQISLQGHLEIRSVVEQARATAGAPDERLSAMMAAFVAWHAECHVSARVIQYEMAALTPEHFAEVSAVRRTIEQMFRAALDDGNRAGVFDVPDVGLTSMALLSLGIDVARWYRPDGSWTTPAIARHYQDLALAMVTSHEA